MTGPADLGLVERIIEQTGVDRTVPPPGWSGYLEALAEALAEWARTAFPGSLAMRLGPAARFVVAALALSILCALVWMALLARRRRRAAPAAAPISTPGARILGERDRRGWREELDRRLARGDVGGALEALWWWFARSVCAARVDPAWTSQELLARSARNDLAPLARTLDRLLYGFERPGPDEVRRFVGRLEEALP